MKIVTMHCSCWVNEAEAAEMKKMKQKWNGLKLISKICVNKEKIVK